MTRPALVAGALLLAAGCSTTNNPSNATTTSHTDAPLSAPMDCSMSEPTDQDVIVPSAVYQRADRIRIHFTACTLDQPSPVAVLYLLHGAGADETQWSDVGVFEAADMAVARGVLAPTVIVLPDELPTLTSADSLRNYQRHLLDEIEPRITQLVPVDPTRRAIGGISRGGGMALCVAAADPSSFVAIGGHSPVEVPDETLAAIAAAGIPVRLDAGLDDPLLGTTEQMAHALRNGGDDVEQVHAPGGHDRSYWRAHVNDYIDFYAEHLGQPAG